MESEDEQVRHQAKLKVVTRRLQQHTLIQISATTQTTDVSILGRKKSSLVCGE